MYGQSFQLAEPSTNGLNARAPGPGQAGEFTRAAGFLAYYEVRCNCCLSSVNTTLPHEEDLAMCTGMMSGLYFCESLDVSD